MSEVSISRLLALINLYLNINFRVAENDQLMNQLIFFAESPQRTDDTAWSGGSWDQGSDAERGLENSDSPILDLHHHRRLRPTQQPQRPSPRSLDERRRHSQPGESDFLYCINMKVGKFISFMMKGVNVTPFRRGNFTI